MNTNQPVDPPACLRPDAPGSITRASGAAQPLAHAGRKSQNNSDAAATQVQGVWKAPIQVVREGRFDLRAPHVKKMRVATLLKQMRKPEDCSPVLITPDTKSSGFTVVHGHCRLEAVRQLGWPYIPAITITNEDEFGLLAEVTAQNEATRLDQVARVRRLVSYVDSMLQHEDGWLDSRPTQELRCLNLALAWLTERRPNSTGPLFSVFGQAIDLFFKPNSRRTPVTQFVVPTLRLAPEIWKLVTDGQLPASYLRALDAKQDRIKALNHGQKLLIDEKRELFVMRAWDSRAFMIQHGEKAYEPMLNLPQDHIAWSSSFAGDVARLGRAIGATDDDLKIFVESLAKFWFAQKT